MRLEDGSRVHYSISRPMNKQDYSDKLLIVLHWEWDKEYGREYFDQLRFCGDHPGAQGKTRKL